MQITQFFFNLKSKSLKKRKKNVFFPRLRLNVSLVLVPNKIKEIMNYYNINNFHSFVVCELKNENEVFFSFCDAKNARVRCRMRILFIFGNFLFAWWVPLHHFIIITIYFLSLFSLPHYTRHTRPQTHTKQ